MARSLNATQSLQHKSLLGVAEHNLLGIIDAVETLNGEVNYDSLLEYLDSAKEEIALMLKKLV